MVRHLMRIMLTVSFTILFINNVSAVSKDSIRYAVRVIKGLETLDKDKESAVRILQQAAYKDSNAYAMNCLGVVYMKGISVKQDSSEAIKCFEAAGDLGYSMSYHNLGMMYKYAKGGVRQDFTKAFKYFQKGADAGNIMACYDMGYMLFKGLGCKQNYQKAVELFDIGVAKDHTPCLYMLGICYRNGYGVVQDTARASYLLNRAAMLNYGPAMEELNRDMPENSWNELGVTVGDALEIPAAMPQITPMEVDANSLSGSYYGCLVVYDWSGNHIIKEKPLMVELNVKNKKINGTWCEGKDTVAFQAKLSDNGKLLFNKGAIKTSARYSKSGSELFRFKNADVCLENNSLLGSIRFYSVSHKEPERPMYICLHKKNTNVADSLGNGNVKLRAYPNPFSGQITIGFDLPENVSSARVGLYSQTGMNLYLAELGMLETGKHSFNLQPQVPDGLYVIRVTAGKYSYQTIVIKKTGII